MGVTELVPPGGELCACHIRKQIDRERIGDREIIE